MSDILNEKVDLSALNLGSFTLSALLGAVVTFCICVIAMRLILSLLRRMLDKTRLDATLRKYALGAVRLVLWVIIVLIVADQLGISQSYISRLEKRIIQRLKKEILRLS